MSSFFWLILYILFVVFRTAAWTRAMTAEALEMSKVDYSYFPDSQYQLRHSRFLDEKITFMRWFITIHTLTKWTHKHFYPEIK